MEKLTLITDNISNFLYTYILIILLIAAGLYFTFRTKFVQITLLKDGFKQLLAKKDGKEGGVSSFQSLMISTASRVGTGNIAGVAVAITIGGPGAVFWMWLIALIGAASAFVESTLAQVYKEKDGDSFRGGPAYYIEKALKARWLGIIFAILLILCFAFGFNALQSFNIADSLKPFLPTGVDSTTINFIIGATLAVLTGLIIFGGIHRIGVISSVVVPIMAALYIALGLFVIVKNISMVPGVIGDIFSQAFSFQAGAGGAAGAAIMYGVKRGLFSNEAGMGSSPNAAAVADVSHPVKQGLAQVISVFIDTLLICTATAVFILLAKDATGEGIGRVQSAFQLEFGHVGIFFITVAILLFAFTSIIGNYSYAESNFKFVFENNKLGLIIFRLVCLVPLVLGAMSNLQLAWNLADILMGLMALVNIIAIVLLGKVAFKCLEDYRKQKREGKDPVFKASKVGIKDTECWN